MAQVTEVHIDDLMQDCSISIVTALEILQSCIKPSICVFRPRYINPVNAEPGIFREKDIDNF